MERDVRLDSPLSGFLKQFTLILHLANIILRNFVKMLTLDGEFSSDFGWGTALWPPAFCRLLALKIMISHIMINDWLDFHVEKKLWKYIHRLFWNSTSNSLRKLLRVYSVIFVKIYYIIILGFLLFFKNTNMKWARPCENVSYALCEQQRRRSACASAQSDQRLCCSLLGFYNISSF